jgi:hypothetical protein
MVNMKSPNQHVADKIAAAIGQIADDMAAHNVQIRAAYAKQLAEWEVVKPTPVNFHTPVTSDALPPKGGFFVNFSY